MAKRKVMIIGSHPVKDDLIRQYQAYDYDIVTEMGMQDTYDEIFLLSDAGSRCPKEADNAIIAKIADIAENTRNAGAQKKVKCHLLVQCQDTLQLLQRVDFHNSIKETLDIYPFTMDEVWAQNIVLDYEPVTVQSEKHIHLVIFGMGEAAETLAIHTAHVAHFPNYIHNHSLRTRITMIDCDATRKSEEMIRKYKHLFDNSYYRTVIPTEKKPIVRFHKPIYEGKREDFVDVEWEFVEAESWCAELRDKLRLWAADSKQLLTIVLADNDGNKNTSDSLLLPQELYEHNIPIHIHKQQNSGYDITQPLVRMAKNVNYIYDQCYNENIKDWKGTLRHAVDIDKEKRDASWDKLPTAKRFSSIYNAMTIPTKMRSIGLADTDWNKFYDITQQDIRLLAQVEHNRWSVEELILGFRPCTDEEQKIISADVTNQKDAYKAKKIHYDLRAYNDLRADKTGRGVQVYDLCLSSCLPLISKTFTEEEGGKA